MRAPRPRDNTIDPTGEFPTAPPEYLPYLLFQAARQRDLYFDRQLAKLGLNLHRWRILAVIRRIENCSMKDLALFSASDRTTLTRAVDQLVDQGLVERWVSPRDRRRVNVSLTPDGEAAHARAATAVAAGHSAMLDGIAADEMRGAARVLRQAIRNLMDDPYAAERVLAYARPPAEAE